MGTRLSPPQKGGVAPPPKKKILAHVYCGQTAGWIKMVLGIEVGLSPGDFVLDEGPVSLPKKGAESPPPIFGPWLLWPNGWMHQDATWYGGRPQPRGLCVRWGLSPPPSQKGAKIIRKKSSSGHHPTTLLGYIFAAKACIDNRKNLLSSNTSSTCLHNMVNFGPQAAEIVSFVWETLANFNRR